MSQSSNLPVSIVAKLLRLCQRAGERKQRETPKRRRPADPLRLQGRPAAPASFHHISALRSFLCRLLSANPQPAGHAPPFGFINPDCEIRDGIDSLLLLLFFFFSRPPLYCFYAPSVSTSSGLRGALLPWRRMRLKPDWWSLLWCSESAVRPIGLIAFSAHIILQHWGQNHFSTNGLPSSS